LAREIGPATPLGVARAILAERLAASGVPGAQREAALLLRAAGFPATDLITLSEAPLGDAAMRLEALARRREGGEPLSRIEGRRGFWRCDFTISRDVLDPRADTETLVEAALEAVRAPGDLRVLDFGVGSGAILCALLGEWPRATGLGVDVSEAAAIVARSNVEALGLGARAEIVVGRWGEGVEGRFDVIVSNPPYIRTGDIPALDREVREHDPRLALDGGADGLDAYRALAPEIFRLLAPRGQFFLEIGAGQASDVTRILRRRGLDITGFRHDLSGVERVLCGRRSRPCASGDRGGE
jgi:release factor glutamine methyltransferase